MLLSYASICVDIDGEVDNLKLLLDGLRESEIVLESSNVLTNNSYIFPSIQTLITRNWKNLYKQHPTSFSLNVAIKLRKDVKLDFIITNRELGAQEIRVGLQKNMILKARIFNQVSNFNPTL